MQILRFAIENYKCFHRETALDLREGFNVIAGQNNVGKTALLEALSLDFRLNPHKSITTMPLSGVAPRLTARVRVEFRLRQDEMQQFLGTPGTHFFPAPQLKTASIGDFVLEEYGNPDLQEFLDRLFHLPYLVIRAEYESHPSERWTTEWQWFYPTDAETQPNGLRRFISYTVHPTASARSERR
jgi:hypothetical protein